MGCRVARPGEFSERAFLNDKLDLVQAEAVSDLINSTSETAARSALRSLHGDFSQEIDKIVAQLIDIRMFVEAAIDFPEEDLSNNYTRQIQPFEIFPTATRAFGNNIQNTFNRAPSDPFYKSKNEKMLMAMVRR